MWRAVTKMGANTLCPPSCLQERNLLGTLTRVVTSPHSPRYQQYQALSLHELPLPVVRAVPASPSPTWSSSHEWERWSKTPATTASHPCSPSQGRGSPTARAWRWPARHQEEESSSLWVELAKLASAVAVVGAGPGSPGSNLMTMEELLVQVVAET